MTRERANWVWRQDHESGIVDAILSYQLFDQQVTEICFSLRIELEKQVKKKKKKKRFINDSRKYLRYEGGQNVIVALLYLASGKEWIDN